MKSRQKWGFFKTYSSNLAWFTYRTIKTKFIITVDNIIVWEEKKWDGRAGINPLPYRFGKDKGC